MLESILELVNGRLLFFFPPRSEAARGSGDGCVRCFPCACLTDSVSSSGQKRPENRRQTKTWDCGPPEAGNCPGAPDLQGPQKVPGSLCGSCFCGHFTHFKLVREFFQLQNNINQVLRYYIHLSFRATTYKPHKNNYFSLV